MKNIVTHLSDNHSAVLAIEARTQAHPPPKDGMVSAYQKVDALSQFCSEGQLGVWPGTEHHSGGCGNFEAGEVWGNIQNRERKKFIDMNQVYHKQYTKINLK